MNTIEYTIEITAGGIREYIWCDVTYRYIKPIPKSFGYPGDDASIEIWSIKYGDDDLLWLLTESQVEEIAKDILTSLRHKDGRERESID